jgi:hypothetical protein
VPSRAEIQCECAFTYMNAVSGEKLTGVFSSMKSLRVSPTAPAAHSTMSWTKRGCAGGQRHASGAGATPLFLGAEPRQEGGRGVAHAPDACVTAADSRADFDTGGEERRPSTRAKLLVVRNIAKCEMPSRSSDPRVGQTKYAIDAGDHSSRVCGPPDFSSLSWIAKHPDERELASDDHH